MHFDDVLVNVNGMDFNIAFEYYPPEAMSEYSEGAHASVDLEEAFLDLDRKGLSADILQMLSAEAIDQLATEAIRHAAVEAFCDRIEYASLKYDMELEQACLLMY